MYTSTSGALGIPPSPAGDGQFIAVLTTAGQHSKVRRNVSFTGLDVYDVTTDFCCRFAGEPPAPFALTAGSRPEG